MYVKHVRRVRQWEIHVDVFPLRHFRHAHSRSFYTGYERG